MGPIRFVEAASLQAELGRWHDLGECRLLGLGLIHHGYSVRLDFDHVWASEGKVRPDLGERERRIVIEMQGVQQRHMEGHLTETMLEHPERINWGLSEVAGVRAERSEVGLRLLVAWEDERHILIDAKSAELTRPDD